MGKRRKRTNSRVPAKGRLRDMADRLWSRAVRDDWANRCAVCGKGKVEAHHLVPRQFEATRYNLLNGVALCASCHKFCPDVSPHLNASGWMDWLRSEHPILAQWYENNPRPEFHGTKNAAYYVAQIQRLRQYVPDDAEKICGVKFYAWLEYQFWNGED